MNYSVTERGVLADATLSQTHAGKAVANAVIRVDWHLRRDDGTYDGSTGDYNVTVYGRAGKALATSARRGARIVTSGEPVVERYTDCAGASRLRRPITAEHHGISTRYAPAVNTGRNDGH